MNMQTITYTAPAKMTGRVAQPHWYAVYTYPKAEKRVYDQLREMGVEAFLPMQEVVRQWSDRKKRVEAPLFPSYVFVKIAATRQFELARIPELVKFIMCDNQPVPIAESEIESIRKVLTGGVLVTNETYTCQPGERIRVNQGRFAGVEGYVIRNSSKGRIIIQIQVRALRQAVSVELPDSFVKVQAPSFMIDMQQ